jgi:hypothetical protein
VEITEKRKKRKKKMQSAIKMKNDSIIKPGGKGYGARREDPVVRRAVETIYVESLCVMIKDRRR